MDRRTFFKNTLDKSSKAMVGEASRRVNKKASRWIRPPFAIDELEFLLACTRCGDCVSACTYNVVFNLPARLGAGVAATPALDILNKGCHLCADWPCVHACKADALVIKQLKSETDAATTIALPKIAIATIDVTTCLPYQGPECGACIPSCPVPGAISLDLTRPQINPDRCTGCGLCREACIVEPRAIRIKSLYNTDNHV